MGVDHGIGSWFIYHTVCLELSSAYVIDAGSGVETLRGKQVESIYNLVYLNNNLIITNNVTIDLLLF